jgi:uncharacterized protein (DUF1501 family)
MNISRSSPARVAGEGSQRLHGATAGAVDSGCGCAEFRTSRRSFLQGLTAMAGASVVSSLIGTTFTQAAFADTPSAGSNVLVVLSLRGGADGLSLVVPHGDPGYAAARPTLAIPASSLIATDDMFGLHPRFAPLLPMWKQGKLAAVHAVGLPQPNRSHFSAVEEVEDADPGSKTRTGWLNRLIGLDGITEATEGSQVGTPLVPTSLFGPEPVLAVRQLDDMTVPGPKDNPVAMRRRLQSLETVWDDAAGPLGRGARSALEVSATFEALDGVPEDPQHGARYPKGDFGQALAQAARLIRADLGTRVVTIDSGTWDMHSNLGTLEWGQMIMMVDQLAQGIQAFFTDLGDIGTRVTMVTISEFGRRVAENASKGVDHGYGNVMLAAGAGVRGGRYYGSWPGLAAGSLIDGDLAVTRDYRSVLSEVVRTRFDADASKVFPDFRPERIGVMLGA